MHSLRKRLFTAAATLAVAMAGVAVVASPAQAASSSCTAPYWYWGWSRTCTTGSIPANSSAYFVRVFVTACNGSPWYVWDTNTGVTVASGADDVDQRIYGLYGSSYRAKLTDACANDYISISN